MKTKKSLILVLMLALACLLLAACGAGDGGEADADASAGGDGLTGIWVSADFDGAFVYTFNDDGTGNYDAAGTDMPFTYTVDGSQLSVLYDGDTVSFDTEFVIDGDTLTIKDSLGEDVVYNRQ
ncbi:MAG: hypothetical protein IKD93_07605 [Firmicutes bacterium]|nr:hypothetical protein [Bacillota bacterium]